MMESSQHFLQHVCCVSQSCPTLCNPVDCGLLGSSVHGILQARMLEWVAMPSLRGSSQPRSPTMQKDSLPSEPPEKSKNTGVGSLSLLRGIFSIQESNRGLLCCRWILYQLSYQGSPSLQHTCLLSDNTIITPFWDFITSH